MSLTCRLCGQALHTTFVDLGMSPLSNAYLRRDQLDGMEPFYPLHVRVCDRCLLVQVPELQKPEAIFGDQYLYFSSYSESWLRHCEAYAAMAVDRFSLGPGSLVVELASNDGYLLQFFRQRGIPVLGVEPAANVAQVARETRGIPTEVAFFGTRTAARLCAEGRQANLIVGNNVLAHVPDLRDFVRGMQQLLKPGGLITVEFPHLMRLVEGNQFDTIYHEHFSYFSFRTARQAFALAGLEVFDVDEWPTHGGSLRVYARHAGERGPASSPRVQALIDRERAAGYDDLAFYGRFRPQVERVKRDLLAFLIGARRRGQRIVGYGAAAKGNTLLNYCGVREDFVEYVVDRSPHKQGWFLPGTHIPIRAPEAIDETRPEYVLILPWNLRDEIFGQSARIRDWGGRLVVAIPSLEILL